MRVAYVVVANNASGHWDSSDRARALWRGWLGLAPRSDVHVHAIQHQMYSQNLTARTGTIYFDALSGAISRLGHADWYMLADDDTHVDTAVLAEFAATASARRIYGNVYDRSKSVHCLRGGGAYVRANGGWPTGGSGVLVPGVLARRMANHSDIVHWAATAKTCLCFDRPLSCALRGLGLEPTLHLPHLFLDSCLYCVDFLKPRRIISCHAASAFRGYNRYAVDKQSKDRKAVNLSFAFRVGAHSGLRKYKYRWPTKQANATKHWAHDKVLASLIDVPPVDRMHAVQHTLCPPTAHAPVDAESYCGPKGACVPG